MRKILFSVLIMFFLSVPALAFSDNFNDGDVAGWTIVSGSWSFPTSGADGSIYLKSQTVSNAEYTLFYPLSGINNYFSVDFYADGNPNDGFNYIYANFILEGDGVTNNTIRIHNTQGGGLIECVGFTCVGFGAYTWGYWYRVSLSVSGTTGTLTYMNATTGTILGSETITYTHKTSNRVAISCQVSSSVSGVKQCGFDNIVVSSVSPSLSNSVFFDSDMYYAGSTGLVSWTFAESGFWDWTYYYSMIIDGPDSGLPVITSPVQVGSVTAYMRNPGLYTAKIGYRPYFGLGDYVTLANDSAKVVQAPGTYLYAPDSAGVGQTVNVSWGFDSSVAVGYIFENYIYTGNNLKQYSVTGLSGVTSIVFTVPGDYYILLYNSDKKLTAAKRSITITDSGVLPPGVVQANLLSLDGSLYQSDSDVVFAYAINTTNWNLYGYFDVNAYSGSGLLLGRVQLIEGQTGSGVLSFDSASVLYTGPAYVNLSARVSMDSSVEFVIVSVPITVEVGAIGYSMSVLPRQLCGNSSLLVKWNVTNASILRLTHTDLKGNSKTDTLNLSIGSGFQKFVFVDIYDNSIISLSLLDLEYRIRKSVSVQYRSIGCSPGGATPTATPTAKPTPDLFGPGEVSGDFAHDYKEWIYLKVGKSSASLFFVGILHIIVFVVVLLAATKGKFPPIAGVGALLALWFNVEIGFMDKMVAVAIVVLVGMGLVSVLKKG